MIPYPKSGGGSRPHTARCQDTDTCKASQSLHREQLQKVTLQQLKIMAKCECDSPTLALLNQKYLWCALHKTKIQN